MGTRDENCEYVPPLLGKRGEGKVGKGSARYLG